MYIVAIAWAYVILMMAVTASSLLKGLAIIVLLGVLPLWLFAYVAGNPRRRRLRVANELTHAPDGENTQPDHE